jgi:hypothetical protein
MARVDSVIFCDRCGAEITWAPYIVSPIRPDQHVRQGEYCCQDCAEGRLCKCAERMDFEDERRNTSMDRYP